MIKQNKILTVLILIGFIAALGLVSGRYRSESRNRSVELVLDWDQVRSVAASSNLSPQRVLLELKSRGVRGVAVTEPTLANLRDDGLIKVESDGRETVLKTEDHTLADQIFQNLNLKLGKGLMRRSDDETLSFNTNFDSISNLGAGLPLEDIRMIQSSPVSLDVVARLQNFSATDPKAIDGVLGQVQSLGIKKVIFASDQVMGFIGLTDATADSMIAHHLEYGAVEFGKQKGDDKLSTKLKGQHMIRVHSIASAEIGNLTPDSAIERYVRAAKERNIRMLYIRLFDAANEEPIAYHQRYLNAITKGLRHDGLDVGESHPYDAPSHPLPLVILVGFGIVAGGVLLLQTLVNLSVSRRVTLTILGIILSSGILAVGGLMGAKLMALLAGLIFPTLAMTLNPIKANGTRKLSVGTAFAALPYYIWISCITLVGAMMIAGILAVLPFMLHIQQYLGIKLAHMLPIMILFFAYIGDAFNMGEKWPDYKKRVANNISSIFKQPFLVWQLLGMVLILAFVGLMVLRTGNDSGIGVSPMELKFRAILDRLMYVRPRTKEFLCGNPALAIALTLALSGKKRWIIPFAIAGSVGQVSLLNTFCHIHTPLLLSAIRSFNGLWVGFLIGVVLIWIYTKFSGYKEYNTKDPSSN